jgi:serine/threonine protein kinase
LNPERIRQIQNLYEAALRMDAPERSAFVRRSCLGDDELFREVEKLLIAAERTGGFAEPTVALTTDPDDDVTPPMEGRRLGPYEILRELGRGGMGVVYLASRADAAYQKLVAIKVVRPPLAAVRVLRRFAEERQILASLDHPNIARLLDGGITDDGLPYLIMEYVEGRAIDVWCDEQRLNVTSRLELFRSVCRAVQYAHQHLIVHLDLKPSNILITADGTVKLLDFGIAKLLHHNEDGVVSASLTLRPRLTPEYASPEQVKGGPVGAASDVYSLGVVLYELLTGHRPYRMNTRVMHEIARVICEEEPARPSTIVNETEDLLDSGLTAAHAVTPDAVSQVREGSPVRLSRRLEGDLDNILLMALQKEPGRRYSSVEQLDSDLGRHLEDLSIHARPNTAAYRFQKFVRRNPAAVAAVVLIVATLFAGITSTLWQERLALRGQQQRVLMPGLALVTYIDVAIFIGGLPHPGSTSSSGWCRGWRYHICARRFRAGSRGILVRLVAIDIDRDAASPVELVRRRRLMLWGDARPRELAHYTPVRLARTGCGYRRRGRMGSGERLHRRDDDRVDCHYARMDACARLVDLLGAVCSHPAGCVASGGRPCPNRSPRQVKPDARMAPDSSGSRRVSCSFRRFQVAPELLGSFNA